MTITPGTWPEGVIARYGTLVGATVDLSHIQLTEETKATQATCAGCRQSEASEWADQYRSHGTNNWVKFQDNEKGDRDARGWAQAHAEKCRALPAPSAPTVSDPVNEAAPKRRLWLPTLRTKTT